MSGLRKRSVLLAGHATSVALEPEFWAVLEEMGRERPYADSRPITVGELDLDGPGPTEILVIADASAEK